MEFINRFFERLSDTKSCKEMGDLVFYNIVFGVILCCLWLGNKNRIFELIGILALISLSVLRYDIGYDYNTYFSVIKHMSTLMTSTHTESFWPFIIEIMAMFRMEPLFVLLTYISSSFQNNSLFVIGFYSLVTIYFTYKSLKDINGLFWGVFVMIMMGYLFISYDQIRQAAAISIFLYSLKYIEHREWRKYFSLSLLAFMFHYSALFIFPIAYFLRFKPKIKLYIFLIILFFALFLLNIWSQYREILFNLLPFYNNYAKTGISASDFGTGLGLLSKILFYSFLMVQMRNKNYVYSNILLIGILLLIFSSGNLNINRISNYFCFVSMLALPICIKRGANLVLFAFVFFLFLNGEILFATGRGANGCVPYDSVFGDNFAIEFFRRNDYN